MRIPDVGVTLRDVLVRSLPDPCSVKPLPVFHPVAADMASSIEKQGRALAPIGSYDSLRRSLRNVGGKDQFGRPLGCKQTLTKSTRSMRTSFARKPEFEHGPFVAAYRWRRFARRIGKFLD